MLSALFGGLALFLFGMGQMSDGLKAAAGEQMKVVLGKVTASRVQPPFYGPFLIRVSGTGGHMFSA